MLEVFDLAASIEPCFAKMTIFWLNNDVQFHVCIRSEDEMVCNSTEHVEVSLRYTCSNDGGQDGTLLALLPAPTEPSR